MAEEDGNGDGPNIVQLNNVQLSAVASSAQNQQSIQHQPQQQLPSPAQQVAQQQQAQLQLQQQQQQLQAQVSQQQMVLNGSAVHSSIATATIPATGKNLVIKNYHY